MEEETFVFLDTQVFDSAKLNFRSSNITRLLEHVSDGRVSLVSTVVTEREIQAHLKRKATQLEESVAKLTRDVRRNPLLGEFAKAKLETIDTSEFQRKFDEAFSSYHEAAKPEILDVDGVSVESVLSKYFDVEPPFGPGKKKSEFPDAIAALALEKWCRESGNSLIVVSGDGDWERVCDECDCFKYQPRLIELLAMLQEGEMANRIVAALRSKGQELRNRVESEFAKVGFFLDELDGDVQTVEIKEVEFLDFNVVELLGSVAVVEVDCHIRFEAEVTCKDPTSWISDPEDKTVYHLNSIDTVIEKEECIGVEVEVSFSDGDENSLTIESSAITSVIVANTYITLSLEDDPQ